LVIARDCVDRTIGLDDLYIPPKKSCAHVGGDCIYSVGRTHDGLIQTRPIDRPIGRSCETVSIFRRQLRNRVFEPFLSLRTLLDATFGQKLSNLVFVGSEQFFSSKRSIDFCFEMQREGFASFSYLRSQMRVLTKFERTVDLFE